MTHRVALASFASLLCCASLAAADVLPASGDKAADALKASSRHGEWVDIKVENGAPLHTWVVYPERPDKAPVVIVVHEIFGMTDWVRAVADDLAAEGFIAVAPDFLSGKGPGGGNSDAFKGDDVRAAISKLTVDEVGANIDVARTYALALPSAGTTSGVVGFCWGGSTSFRYVVRQPALNAAVVFYGTAPLDPEDIAKIKTPVLGHYGGDDGRVTSTVEDTRNVMGDAKKSYEPMIHPNAGHGFMRQQDGKDGANLKAATAAWTRTLAFLREHLGK